MLTEIKETDTTIKLECDNMCARRLRLCALVCRRSLNLPLNHRTHSFSLCLSLSLSLFIYIYIHIYIYIYILEETCPYTGTGVCGVCWNPQVKCQSRIVDPISKLRHSVVNLSIVDNDSNIRQRQ